ncbi:hypothetical protein [Natrinema salaciae]|uniref:Uncharacterized protein n=1 Tax=Natrinema salaciae TaxID=1186196 RepID=A0A1H9RHA5_9EURY|nr:hypothetical protein [Natrinema salaciae]SER72017.1 hypothetical protein SAMN04489841_4398 [Natrinema salaciae]
MSLDRHAAERRRFARLLGTDGEQGSGLPIGGRDADGEEDDRAADDRDIDRSSDDATTKSRGC